MRESIIEAVREERPLARKQEALEGAGAGQVEGNEGGAENSGSGGAGAGGGTAGGTGGGKALLKDEDRELERVYCVRFCYLF